MEDRYIRQKLLKEIGPSGQEKLGLAKATIVGCGGLGSIVAPYLAGAGIGHLTLIDGDNPHISNLHRQVIFHAENKNTKSKHLADHIQQLNPEISVRVVEHMLNKENIETILTESDLVIECTDDMMCKYLVNDFCHLHHIPLVYGAIYKFEGYVSLFENKDAASIHLRDVFPDPDTDIPSCSEVGVLGTIAGIIGLLQANEALKFILGLTTLRNTLLTYDCLSNTQFKLQLKKTFTLDVQALYQKETYQPLTCETVPEISVDTYLSSKSDFQVISILENVEHEAIDRYTYHIPLSIFPKEEWIKTYEEAPKKVLFYCQTGKRSSHLVKQLLDINPHLDIYSLNGGLRAVKDAH
jgi:molybdopterin/thiamine biosynthesis adenylyltransferase/rhodanese-related sulfurtransferase